VHQIPFPCTTIITMHLSCLSSILYRASGVHMCACMVAAPPGTWTIRASLVTSPARPPIPCFFIRTAKIGPVASSVPRFRSDLGLHPSGEPRPSLAFWGALGDSRRKKCARNGEETSCALCGPDLSAREIGHRPHCLVFHASSSSPHIVFRVL
jgi:hypothetical protein